MKMVEINKMFSDKVAEYLMNGYTICPQSMSGHQGEIGKVDLIKGTELIRIWLNSESSYNWSDDTAWHDTIIFLRVSRWNHPVKKILPDMTVWNSDLEHIEEYSFYQITRWGGDWYVDSLEEALRIQHLRHVRWRNVNESGKTLTTMYADDKFKKIAANYMKRKQGYQRVSWDKLYVIANIASNKTTIYYVMYNGKKYKLS